MKIKNACINDLQIVEFITLETINEIYPQYYAKGAVTFFISHHNTENIRRDIQSNQVLLVYNNDDDYAIGTVTIKGNEICRLFVLPNYQKQGYGTAMLDFAEKIISEHEESIVLDASLPAKNMYLKKGYIPIETHVLHTENDAYLCYDVMEKKTTNTKYKVKYDGKRFISQSNTKNGEITSDTVFYYHQNNHVIWAEYAGGGIIKGFLVGTVEYDGRLDFSYQHLNNKKQVRIGMCKSEPFLLANGKVELHETWQWLNGDKSQGNSILKEI